MLAFSSGNHAQAVALAARLLGSEATILMPEDAPQSKLDATRGYGAEIVATTATATTATRSASSLRASAAWSSCGRTTTRS